MSTSTQQLRKTCTTHTNPGLDNSFRLMLPICHFAFHCKVNQYRTNIPFNYIGRCIPKAQKGPLQNQIAAFQRYKIHYKKSLSLSHGNHLLSSIITRPHTTMFSGAWICHLISCLQKTILFTSLPKSESRLSGLSPFAVTYGYASMSMQLDLEMWGIVSRVSLGCCCVVRQNRNQMNIDAQQNTTAKTCAL